MASVFLSYSREDHADAKALARIIENAGHEVWWDRQIVSGNEFASEIESALEEADLVLVAWSKSSVRSAWVRDEAAIGRDSNRLLPLSIDGTVPPIGFRQFQTFDLSKWNRRAKHAAATKLLEAISRRMGANQAGRDAAATPLRSAVKAAVRSRWWLAALAAFALVIIATATALLLRSSAGKAEQPIVAVLPFADLSPNQDQAYFTQGIAEEILTSLGSQPGIRVIGRTSASMLGNEVADVRSVRRRLGVTHILEGSARVLGRELRLNVRLVNTADGTQVWAEEYQRSLVNVFAVQDEIARAVTQRLKGTLTGNDARAPPTTIDAYQLYLAARALTRERKEQSLKEALRLAQQVIRSAPNYAPAHALYAELLMHLSDDPLEYGSIPVEKARALGLPHARRAIELAPNAADGYAALGLLQRGENKLEPLKRAVALDPARAELRVWLGIHQNLLGQNRDALHNYRIASEIEPLWPVPINRYVATLAATGRPREALREVDEFVARGGAPAQAHRFRSFIHEQTGDLARAAEAARTALELDPNLPFTAERLAMIYVTLGLPQLASQVPVPARSRYTRLLRSGDWSQISQAARAADASLWFAADGDLLILVLAAERDWSALVRLYDQRPQAERIPCPSKFDLSAPFVLALRAHGRSAEAADLLRCYSDRLRREADGPVRAPGMSQGQVAFQQAQLAALQGREDDAIAAIDRALARGWRGDIWGDLTRFAAFHSLRERPEFHSLQLRLTRILQAQRMQVLRRH